MGEVPWGHVSCPWVLLLVRSGHFGGNPMGFGGFWVVFVGLGGFPLGKYGSRGGSGGFLLSFAYFSGFHMGLFFNAHGINTDRCS